MVGTLPSVVGILPFLPYGVCKFDETGLNIIEEVINDSEHKGLLTWEDTIIVVDSASNDLKEDSAVRSGKASFLPPGDELTDLFGNLIQDYNRNYSGWNFDIEFIESIQLAHYHEGDFYDWHTDSFVKPVLEKDGKPYNRKVSVTVFLNDPDEYEGGEFDLETKGPNWDGDRFETFKLSKGHIIIFPSYMWHRVRPVTSGVRKSLVLWIKGPPFK